MQNALQTVRKEFGRKYPLIIGGRETGTEREICSMNPARPGEVVGRIAKGGRAEADAALAAAQAAFPQWSRTGVEERSRVLERAADLLRRERFELAALEVFETGKPWIEGDADVAEATTLQLLHGRDGVAWRLIARPCRGKPAHAVLHSAWHRGGDNV